MNELKKLLRPTPSRRSLQVAQEIEQTIIEMRRIQDRRRVAMERIRREKEEPRREQ